LFASFISKIVINIELDIVFLKLPELVHLEIDGLLISDLTLNFICPQSGSLTRTSPGVDISSVHVIGD
jgi:hypothetical protein